MDTRPMTSASLSASVIAVPPVARDSRLNWSVPENTRIIHHLEAGGVTTLLYGGNAVLAHASVSEYAALLEMLANIPAPDTIMIPSVGPLYGLMMDQGTVLRDFNFPTVMLLPSRDGLTPDGLAYGLRQFVDRIERPVVLYLKHDGVIDAETIRKMSADGLISWIKYGITRDNPSKDDYLKTLIDAVGASMIVSGMGEQPAVVHLREFGLAGYTSGLVCIAPGLSMRMLRAIQKGDVETANQIRKQFAPLEALRDTIHPVRALHAAVALAGIAETGPITPFLSSVSPSDELAIRAAAIELRRLA